MCGEWGAGRGGEGQVGGRRGLGVTVSKVSFDIFHLFIHYIWYSFVFIYIFNYSRLFVCGPLQTLLHMFLFRYWYIYFYIYACGTIYLQSNEKLLRNNSFGV